MIGRLKDLLIGRNGEQVLTVTVNADIAEMFDSLKDDPVEITIKKFRKKRSLDANAYMWTLIDKLSVATGIDKAELYKESIKNIAGTSEIVCVPNSAVTRLCASWSKQGLGWQTDCFNSKIKGCTNVTLYFGSSSYDSAQMSRLIDLIVEECKSAGIVTDPEEYINSIKERWNG